MTTIVQHMQGEPSSKVETSIRPIEVIYTNKDMEISIRKDVPPPLWSIYNKQLTSELTIRTSEKRSAQERTIHMGPSYNVTVAMSGNDYIAGPR